MWPATTYNNKAPIDLGQQITFSPRFFGVWAYDQINVITLATMLANCQYWEVELNWVYEKNKKNKIKFIPKRNRLFMDWLVDVCSLSDDILKRLFNLEVTEWKFNSYNNVFFPLKNFLVRQWKFCEGFFQVNKVSL